MNFPFVIVQTKSGGDLMPKKKQEKEKLFEDNEGVEAVKNQLFESYQNGVVEDQLHNNKNIHTYNNQNK